jgi:hybrid cluster-associated redox disulfide protein
MMQLDPKMTIGELLERYPHAVDAFIKRKMLCVGCPAEAYHTLEDSAHFYGCSVDALRDAILEAVQSGEGP